MPQFVAQLKFTRAGRGRPRDKGGERWLHEKAAWFEDKAGARRLRPPVYFESGKTYSEDVVPAHHMELLSKRHPDIFTLIDGSASKAKAAKKTDGES